MDGRRSTVEGRPDCKRQGWRLPARESAEQAGWTILTPDEKYNPKKVYYLSEIVTNKLETHLGQDIVDVQPISGGDINEARLIRTQDEGLFFVKLNDSTDGEKMLSAEARGLNLLQKIIPAQLLIPELVAVGTAGDTAFLLLEYLHPGTSSPDFWEYFGMGLANLHRKTHTHFGLDHHNFIGRLPQANHPTMDWPDFYTAQRLLPQATWAYERELLDLRDMERLERLFQQLADIFPTEPPALIHGDLWNGNFLIHPSGKAALIDPAVSYSHREMDLAMSRLFGGFPQEFYSAYHQSYPLAPGWEERLAIGQLYYLLVHLNMFGVGYLPAVKRIIKQF